MPLTYIKLTIEIDCSPQSYPRSIMHYHVNVRIWTTFQSYIGPFFPNHRQTFTLPVTRNRNPLHELYFLLKTLHLAIAGFSLRQEDQDQFFLLHLIGESLHRRGWMFIRLGDVAPQPPPHRHPCWQFPHIEWYCSEPFCYTWALGCLGLTPVVVLGSPF